MHCILCGNRGFRHTHVLPRPLFHHSLTAEVSRELCTATSLLPHGRLCPRSVPPRLLSLSLSLSTSAGSRVLEHGSSLAFLSSLWLLLTSASPQTVRTPALCIPFSPSLYTLSIVSSRLFAAQFPMPLCSRLLIYGSVSRSPTYLPDSSALIS